MAVSQNPLIGRTRNKIGGVVMSKWKGRNTIRTKPDQVANPNTIGQQAQRSAVRQLNEIGRVWLGAIRLGFSNVRAITSEWSEFFKVNMNEAFTMAPPLATLNIADIIVARGSMSGFDGFTVGTPVGQAVPLSWTDNTGAPGASASDLLQVCVIKDDKSDSCVFLDVDPRSAASSSITLPTGFTPASCSLYAFFSNAAGDDSSDSVFAAI